MKKATLTLSLGDVDFTLTPSSEEACGSLEFVQNGDDGYLIHLTAFSGTLRVSNHHGASEMQQGITPKSTHVLKKRKLTEQHIANDNSISSSSSNIINATSQRIRDVLAEAVDDASVATDVVMDDDNVESIVEAAAGSTPTSSPATAAVAAGPIICLQRSDTTTTTSPAASQCSPDPTLQVLSQQPTLLGQPDFSQTQFSDVESMLQHSDNDDYEDNDNNNNNNNDDVASTMTATSVTKLIKPARVSLGTSPLLASSIPKGHDPPCPRWGHTMAAIDKNRVLVYGGQTLDANSDLPVTLSDVYLYDCTNQTWFKPFNCHGLPRQWHTATYVPDRHLLISFGGEAVCPHTKKVKTESTVMVLDTEIMLWYPPTVTGHVPSSRSGHTATLLGQSDLVVFGGVRNSGSKWLNTVSVLDCKLWRWTTVKAAAGNGNGGAAPQPRSYHSAVAVGDSRIVVFGGNNADQCFDSVHVLEKMSVAAGDTIDDTNSNCSNSSDGNNSNYETTTKWKWSHPTTTGSSKPKARTGHSAVLLDNGTTIWVYGGWDPNDDDDDGNGNDNDADMLFGDSFFLDTTNWTWTSGPTPVVVAVGAAKANNTGCSAKRVGHEAVLNEASEICVFGGRVPGNVFSGDFLTMPPTSQSSSSSPSLH